MKVLIKSIIIVFLIFINQACAQPISTEPTISPPTISPFPSITLTAITTPTVIPSPSPTPIPEDLIEQIYSYYVLMFLIQINAELVSEAANRVQDDILSEEDAFLVIYENGLPTDILDHRTQELANKNIAVHGSMSADWAKLKSAHFSTTDILSRWMSHVIMPAQVLVEMSPIQTLIEDTLGNTERTISEIFSEHNEDMAETRQKTLYGLITAVFPVPILEACAGESLNEADISKQGRLAFVSNRDGNPEIYVINADGTGLIRLTNNPAGDYNPSWSPDGKQITFYSERDGNAEIYVVNIDGTGLTQLTNHRANDYDTSWSPDGMKIAFHSHRYLGAARIFVMNSDGSGVTRLTDPSYDDWSPVWSPDGSEIIFVSSRGPKVGIWIMRADGSMMRNLSNSPTEDGWPAWSPDGEWIVFQSTRDGDLDIYMMRKIGGEVLRLTDDPSLEYDPNWSPDGSRISYTSNRSGNREICIINVDGKGIYNLTNHPANDWGSVWQPEVESN